jgi:tyrosyl-tRNA synthetase
LFGQGDLADLPAATLAAALSETPHGTVEAAEVVGGALPPIDELLVRSGLVTSKSQARRTIGEGGAYLNNARVTEESYAPTTADLLGGQWLVLRRGKRSVGGIKVLN